MSVNQHMSTIVTPLLLEDEKIDILVKKITATKTEAQIKDALKNGWESFKTLVDQTRNNVAPKPLQPPQQRAPPQVARQSLRDT